MTFKWQYREKLQIMTLKNRTIRDDLFVVPYLSDYFQNCLNIQKIVKKEINYDIQTRNIEKIIIEKSK